MKNRQTEISRGKTPGYFYEERKYMEKWVIAAKRADFNQIGQQFHIDPVIARLIRNRDVI